MKTEVRSWQIEDTLEPFAGALRVVGKRSTGKRVDSIRRALSLTRPTPWHASRRLKQIFAVAQYLATEPALRFSLLSDITTVDNFPLEPRFEVLYHLVSIDRRDRIRLKVRLAGKNPSIASVTPVWPTANWHERESFDLFGIQFPGHPDLKRILMPDDWEGFPLRKDYPTEGYR